MVLDLMRLSNLLEVTQLVGSIPRIFARSDIKDCVLNY